MQESHDHLNIDSKKAFFFYKIAFLREPIRRKFLLLFLFSQTALTPPPPTILLEPIKELFKNPILFELKFLKVFGLC
jgi:hypothetical protein